MSEFKIELPGSKAKAYNRISLLILVMNMLAFGLLFFKQSTIYGYVAAVVMIFLMSACLFTYAGKNLKLQNQFTIFCIGLSAIAWIIIGDAMLAVLMAVVTGVSYYTLQKPVIIINDDGIKYPSFPKRFYTWAQVNACMLKEDILTLDLKNNQLLQFTLPPGTMEGTEQANFNSFCIEKLRKTE